MKHWQLAIVALTLLATAGCRTHANVAILERELRLKEDEIYRLRDCIRDMHESGRPCENGSASGSTTSDSARRDSPTPPRKETSAGPTDASPPMIEMPSRPAGELPDTLKPQPDSTFTPSGDSRRVAAIALNRSLTGGMPGSDGRGDQGLLVVVEPRDAAGRVIDAPAEMIVVLLDAAVRDEDGMAACVARWEFTAAETAAMFRRGGASGAIHLTTTWPGDPPQHDQLHLFVRYVTRDGRKLEANQPIELARSGGMASGRESAPPTQTVSQADAANSNRPGWSPHR